MIPDPTTEAGMAEALHRAQKRKIEADAVRNRAKENPDEEPSGKLTIPNQIDLNRDRKKADE